MKFKENIAWLLYALSTVHLAPCPRYSTYTVPGIRTWTTCGYRILPDGRFNYPLPSLANSMSLESVYSKELNAILMLGDQQNGVI